MENLDIRHHKVLVTYKKSIKIVFEQYLFFLKNENTIFNFFIKDIPINAIMNHIFETTFQPVK